MASAQHLASFSIFATCTANKLRALVAQLFELMVRQFRSGVIGVYVLNTDLRTPMIGRIEPVLFYSISWINFGLVHYMACSSRLTNCHVIDRQHTCPQLHTSNGQCAPTYQRNVSAAGAASYAYVTLCLKAEPTDVTQIGVVACYTVSKVK